MINLIRQLEIGDGIWNIVTPEKKREGEQKDKVIAEYEKVDAWIPLATCLPHAPPHYFSSFFPRDGRKSRAKRKNNEEKGGACAKVSCKEHAVSAFLQAIMQNNFPQ